MADPIDTPVYLELSGTAYNIMLRKPDNFDKFKIDLVVTDPEELKKLEDYETTYGMNVRSELTFPMNGKIESLSGVSYTTFRAKHQPDGDFPRTSVEAIDTSNGEPITQFIEHGAEVTVKFKVYGYKGGTNTEGFSYSGGNGFQLESVRVHSYTPWEAKPKDAASQA
jgi:hypothetical protein